MRWMLNRLGIGRNVQPPPSWAPPFKGGGYDQFEKLLKAHLTSTGIPFSFEREEGIVYINHPKPRAFTLGLENIAQECAASPTHQWREQILRHFTITLGTAANLSTGDYDKYADFDNARPLLKIRLYAAGLGEPDSVVRREYAEGIDATLTLDLTDQVLTVPRKSHFAKWGISEDEAFRIALENVKAQDSADAEVIDIGDGVTVSAITGESFFTASLVMALDDYLPPDCTHGAIVCIPHRHALVFHPILSLDVIPAMNTMIPMAAGMYQQGPGSISGDVYWWRSGKLQLQPSNITGQNINFQPTAEFITEVLNTLK